MFLITATLIRKIRMTYVIPKQIIVLRGYDKHTVIHIASTIIYCALAKKIIASILTMMHT